MSKIFRMLFGKKRGLLLAVFFLFYGWLSVQIAICQVPISERSRVDELNDKAWLYRNTEPEKAQQLSQQALELSQQIDYKAGEGLSLRRLGIINRNQGDYNKAIKFFEQSLAIEQAQESLKGQASCANGLAVTYKQQGQYKKAITHFAKSQELYQELDRPDKQAISYNNIGNLYLNLGLLNRAEANYYRSKTLFEQVSDSNSLADVFNNLGIVFMYREAYDSALQYYERSLSIWKTRENDFQTAETYANIGAAYYYQGQSDSAEVYYRKALALEEHLVDLQGVADTYNNLALINKSRNKFEDALSNYTYSLQLYTDIGNGVGLAEVNHNIGVIYQEQQDYNKALEYYNKTLYLADSLDALPAQLKALESISETYTQQGEYAKAYQYYKTFVELTDSLYHQDEATKLAGAHQKPVYDLRIRQLEDRANLQQITLNLHELKFKKKEIEFEQHLFKRNAYITGLLLLLIFLFFITLIYRQKLRSNQLLAEKNAELNRQKIIELEKDQKLKAIDAMLEGQERERKRIAEDLHDRLGSMLSSIKLYFNGMEARIENLEKPDKALYDKANTLLDVACTEVRKIAHDLVSGDVHETGLVKALQQLQDTIEGSSQLSVKLITFELEERVDAQLEQHTYRIIQELVNNTLKHAKASEINIQLTRHEDSLNIVYEDNGIGFNPDQLKSKDGMGLNNIQSRLKNFNGTCVIDSSSNKGTTVIIDIPLRVVL